jgi:phosphohistidine swiveling domain-containing protein
METQTDSFPVAWDSPEDAQAMWLLDEIHSIRQITSLDFDLRIRTLIDGSLAVNAAMGSPFGGESRLIHAYVYSKMVLPDLPAEAINEAMKKFDAAILAVAAELESRWEKTWLPEIQAILADLTAFELRGAPLPALLQHLAEMERRIKRLWELHAEVLMPTIISISVFDDAYRDLFPDAKSFDVFDLLSGFPNKTVEGSARLWQIGRSAAASPSLRALIVESEPKSLLSALNESPEGRALAAEIQGYLRVYGETNDDLYLDLPTWLEDPTPVLQRLREAVLQPERDLAEELLKTARHREERLAAVRAQLASYPRPVVDEFEALLKAAQVATVLSEDHHFWIDCKVTYHARRASLEIGSRLVERGVLDSPSDVLHLTLAEVLSLDSLEHPDAPSSHFRGLIAERRAEAARFADVKPPPLLGVPQPFPALDSITMKAGFKFNALGALAPSAEGELRGLSGSRGRAKGPARLVRSLDEAERLRPGDILVAATTLPSWTPLFATAAAVVTGSGGILSHAAVVAREYGIAAVVGARGAMEAIRDGQIIEVDGDEGVVRLAAS